MIQSRVADYTSRKGYNAEWRKKNREKINEKKRLWRAERKEKQKRKENHGSNT